MFNLINSYEILYVAFPNVLALTLNSACAKLVHRMHVYNLFSQIQ